MLGIEVVFVREYAEMTACQGQIWCAPLEGSFNKVKEKGNPEAADALLKVAEEVNKSANKEAGEMFDAFNKELQAPAPKKSS